jgi:uncharacterized membrane protein YfcA
MAIALYLLAADLTGLSGGGGVVFVVVLLVLLASPAAVPAILAWRSWAEIRKATNADLEEADSLVAATVPLLLVAKESCSSASAR